MIDKHTIAGRMGCVFLIALATASVPASAASLGSADMPFAHFTDKDREILIQNLDAVLEKGADGQARKWSNPDTKASGQITPIKSFERGGAPCRTLTVSNKAKGRSATGPYTFCKQPPGDWKLAPS
jgi:surface antigen